MRVRELKAKLTNQCHGRKSDTELYYNFYMRQFRGYIFL